MNDPAKLLIIDDEQEILKVLSKYFRNHSPYQIVTADNGLDGIKLLEPEGQNFALVITDLMMEDLGGVGVITILKKKYPHIPVIAMTGWGRELQEVAREKMADLVIEKPLSFSHLHQEVDRLISKTTRMP